MRPAIVVFGAIGTIEIATVRDVKTALQRFPVEETLTRLQNVIAGEFTADFAKSFMRLIGRFSLGASYPRRNSFAASLAYIQTDEAMAGNQG